MGIIDVPGYSKAQADARYLLPRGPASIAWLGDSLTANGTTWGANTGQAVGTLSAAASVGGTTITVAYPYTVANGYSNTTPPGTQAAYVLDKGLATEEYVHPSAVSGTGPYTLTVAALTKAHATGGTIRNVPGYFGSQSLPTWVTLLSNNRLCCGGIYAHGGYTTAQIKTIYLPQVIADKPGICVLNTGTNDGWDMAATFPLALTMIDSLIAAGILPVVTAAPPSGGNASSGAAVKQLRWNMAMAVACMKRGIPFLDTYASLVDDGSGVAGYGIYKQTYNYDNTHPSDIGAKVWAQAIVNALSAYTPLFADPAMISTNAPSGDTAAFPFASNPLMFTDTNADGVPDAWSTNSSAVTASIVTESGAPGKMFSVTRTTGSTTQANISSSASYPLTAGHKYRVYLRIKTSGLDAAWTNSQTLNTAGSPGGLTTSAFPGFSLYLDTASSTNVWGFKNWKRDIPLSTYTYDFVCPTGLGTYTPPWRLLMPADVTSTPAYTVEFQVYLADLTYLGV
jgi:hypothetical protein